MEYIFYKSLTYIIERHVTAVISMLEGIGDTEYQNTVYYSGLLHIIVHV